MGSAIDTGIKVASLGTIDSDIGGEKARKSAIESARNATNSANAASQEAWDRQQTEMEPWKQAGLKALSGLQDGSFFQQDPGYQFRLDEGNKAINAAMAARGNAGGGAALKELTRYGQGFASNEYQNAWNRTNQLANYGNQASMSLGNFAGGHGTNIANNAIGYGNANAAAEIARSNRDAQMFGGFMSLGGQALGAMSGSPTAATGTAKKSWEIA